MNTQNLVAWLPFDESTTQDLCGNTWTTSGSPNIQDGTLYLDGSSYLQNDSIAAEIGSDIWTVHWQGNCTENGNDHFFFGTHNANYSTTGEGNHYWIAITYNSGNPRIILWGDDTASNLSLSLNQRYHYALSYDGINLRLFVDGVLKVTKAIDVTLGGAFRIGCVVNRNNGRNTATDFFKGTIDNFIILKGEAWTQDFTPPTQEDYIQLRLDMGLPAPFEFDVERKISNAVEVTFDVERKFKWRYVNAGNANDLLTSGTTLTDLPATQSKTGTAFYQTTRAKCFDLPATPEIWIKFDAYFNGSNRWRAYNGGSNGTTGICSQTNGNLDFWVNDRNVHTVSNGAAKNQLQTVLLHMISDSSAGVVEAWIDGNFIYRYTGDVNHGQDFADIYLQSDGAGTFFSNVIISNVEVKLGEGKHNIFFDTERRVKKQFEIPFYVQREIIPPVIVQFIGEHFNHLIPNFKIYRDKPRRIILPKDSIAYICAVGAGVVDIYSDTNNNAVTTGNDFDTTSNIYTKLDTCRTVYFKVSEKPTAVQVIKWFMKSLDETTLSGTAALDEAINSATGGLLSTTTALISSFLNDLDNSASYSDFLETYCDIILGNVDTGAITGSDAGGLIPKDKYSIVPEPVPIEDWVVPEGGSSKTIDGLTVHFPVVGSDGSTFSDAENHILAGLNSVWIEQSLILVKNSFGLDFNETGTSVKTISVGFENNDSSNVLAHVNWNYSSGKATSLTLTINMYYYNQIITSSEDGQSSGTSQYLDRTLAHEFTHAVMAANIDNFHSLPTYIKEGTAELVHGIDDVRRSTIFSLLTSRRADLETTFANGTTSNSSDPYAAGYMLLRYLAKQGQNQINSSAPFALEINNLLISDGAIDYNYNALTDNTRQRLFLDVLRTLIKSTSFYLDVEILDVFPVEVLLDVTRNILAKIKLMESDTSQYFSGDTSEPIGDTPVPIVIPSQVIPIAVDDSSTLQSLEISLSEQQLTDQVNFVTTAPFEIMQQFGGQYLDYVNQMRVETIRQDGILYSCSCCSDIDELLYTQFNYQLDSGFVAFVPDYNTMTLRILPPYEETSETIIRKGKASAHLQKIAALLGASEVICNFDDFVSTMNERQEDVTYQDLILQLFGWTSRLPQRMINTFLRNGKLYAIQRGKEEHVLDLSQADCSYPTIEKRLIRTMWGSGKSGIIPATEKVTISNKHTVPGHKVFPPPPSLSSDGKTSYVYHDVSGYGGIEHGYALTSTETRNDDGGRTIVDYFYDFVGGVYTCTSEQSRTYDEHGNKVDEHTTIHDHLTPSQQFSRMDDEDGNTIASNVGSNLPGFYNEWYWLSLPHEVGYEYDINKITGYNPLIDTEFPVLDADIYSQLIAAYAWLNRRTQVTISFDVYDYPHLIDFNDRILFGGYEYYLVNNTALSNARIRNKQSLRLVRWF